MTRTEAMEVLGAPAGAHWWICERCQSLGWTDSPALAAAAKVLHDVWTHGGVMRVPALGRLLELHSDFATELRGYLRSHWPEPDGETPMSPPIVCACGVAAYGDDPVGQHITHLLSVLGVAA